MNNNCGEEVPFSFYVLPSFVWIFEVAVQGIENVADWIINNVVTDIITALAVCSSDITPEHW